jgi:hypothetical protein
MTGRRLIIERLALRVSHGSRVDPRAISQEIARALAATPGLASRARLSVAVDPPRRGEAGTVFARRIGRAAAAAPTRRGGGDAG